MMDFFRIAGGILVVLILVLTLGRQEKDMALALTMVVCCMTAMAAFQYLQPVLDFMSRLESGSGLNQDYLRSLLRILGIGLLAELANQLCQDSGNGAMGKALQLLSSAAILQNTVPMLEALLDLLESILGEL